MTLELLTRPKTTETSAKRKHTRAVPPYPNRAVQMAQKSNASRRVTHDGGDVCMEDDEEADVSQKSMCSFLY